MSPLAFRFRRKWYRTSMCLLLEEPRGSAVKSIVPLLSCDTPILVDPRLGRSNVSIPLTYMSSTNPFGIVTCSASVADRVRHFYDQENQDTSVPCSKQPHQQPNACPQPNLGSLRLHTYPNHSRLDKIQFVIPLGS